jgi:hypothetical protein
MQVLFPHPKALTRLRQRHRHRRELLICPEQFHKQLSLVPPSPTPRPDLQMIKIPDPPDYSSERADGLRLAGDLFSPVCLLPTTRSAETIHIPPAPDNSPVASHQGSASPTERMHPTFPMPDPQTGELKIDPEIALKAKGFDFSLSLYYSTNAKLGTEWGYGRSASTSGYLTQSGSTATITRGDFGQQYYQQIGTSGGGGHYNFRLVE